MIVTQGAAVKPERATMAGMSERVRISLPEYAQRLGLSWGQAYRRVLRGEVRAARDRSGRWVVDVGDPPTTEGEHVPADGAGR
jgi:hypothetical protein